LAYEEASGCRGCGGQTFQHVRAYPFRDWTTFYGCQRSAEKRQTNRQKGERFYKLLSLASCIICCKLCVSLSHQIQKEGKDCRAKLYLLEI
jgi:hypothetical protein